MTSKDQYIPQTARPETTSSNYEPLSLSTNGAHVSES